MFTEQPLSKKLVEKLGNMYVRSVTSEYKLTRQLQQFQAERNKSCIQPLNQSDSSAS